MVVVCLLQWHLIKALISHRSRGLVAPLCAGAVPALGVQSHLRWSPKGPPGSWPQVGTAQGLRAARAEHGDHRVVRRAGRGGTAEHIPGEHGQGGGVARWAIEFPVSCDRGPSMWGLPAGPCAWAGALAMEKHGRWAWHQPRLLRRSCPGHSGPAFVASFMVLLGARRAQNFPAGLSAVEKELGLPQRSGLLDGVSLHGETRESSPPREPPWDPQRVDG